jgi:hypothetical protein
MKCIQRGSLLPNYMSTNNFRDVKHGQDLKDFLNYSMIPGLNKW